MFLFLAVTRSLGSSAGMELDLGCEILGYESSESAKKLEVEKQAKTTC